jgi:hypothetical protein
MIADSRVETSVKLNRLDRLTACEEPPRSAPTSGRFGGRLFHPPEKLAALHESNWTGPKAI